MKLAKPSQVAFAAHATHALRVALQNDKTNVHTLKRLLASSEDIIDDIRASAPYNANIKCLVQNFDRLAVDAGKRVLELAAQEAYEGPRRGSMSIAQKTAFIAENGKEKFLRLPL